MTDEQVATLTMDMLGELMSKLPTKREKSEALSMLLMAGYNLLRTVESDEFVRGWMESALKDVSENQPAVALRASH